MSQYIAQEGREIKNNDYEKLTVKKRLKADSEDRSPLMIYPSRPEIGVCTLNGLFFEGIFNFFQ